MLNIEKDVVIVGGGISGVHAAIAAGRAGLKTLLVEREGNIGGISTLGLCNPHMRYWLGSEFLVSGIFEETMKRIEKKGGTLKNSFDSELMKIVMLELLSEANVQILFHAIPVGIETGKEEIKSLKLFTSQGYSIKVEASYFIDATGEGTLAYLSGAQYFEGDTEGNNQAMTLMFTMSGVDFNEVSMDIEKNSDNFFAWVKPRKEVMSVAGYFEETEKAKSNGLDKLQDYFFFIQLPGEGRISVNTTHVYNKNPNNPLELSEAVVEATAQVDTLLEFTRKYVKGFEKAGLEKIATLMGIRESRRIKGLYVFSGDDVANYSKFEDGVVKACYGVDIHKAGKLSNQDRNNIPVYESYYEIPLRSLISADYLNLGISGRCFSSDFVGHSAARIMPTVAGMGQVLGTTVALANQRNCSLKEVAAPEALQLLEKVSR